MPFARLAMWGAVPRLSRSAAGRSGSLLTESALLAGVAGIAVLVGYLCVYIGDAVAARPAFAVGLPLIIVMGFMFALSPKALVVAVIVLRGGADPIFQNAQFGGLGGLGGLVNLAVIGLLIALVAREPTRVPRTAWWVWLPFLVSQFIGLGYSPDAYQSLRQVLGQVSTFSMFLLAFFLVDDLRSFDKALRLVVASSFLVVTMTVVAIARGDMASSLEGMETVSGRYAGPFPHPNFLAFYLVLLIGVLLYLFKRSSSTLGLVGKAACGGYLLLLLVLLYATKTRSAWLGAGVLFLLYGLVVERRYVLYMVAALFAGMLFPEFRDRIYDLTEGNTVTQYGTLNSFAWRKYLWTTSLSWMEPVRYLTGYGYNAFFNYSVDFFPISGGARWNAHSVFVQLFFDLGIVGVLSFIWLFAAAFRQMWPAIRQDPSMKVIFGAVLGTYFLVSSSDNMLNYLVFNWYFWFTIGAVCAMAQVTRPVPASVTGAGDSSRIWTPGKPSTR